jgi:hypothetical protein
MLIKRPIGRFNRFKLVRQGRFYISYGLTKKNLVGIRKFGGLFRSKKAVKTPLGVKLRLKTLKRVRNSLKAAFPRPKSGSNVAS